MISLHPLSPVSGPIVMASGWSLPFPLDPWVWAGVLGLVGLLLLAGVGRARRSHRRDRGPAQGFTWHRHTFCQHFLITGATGPGKTLSGILPLLFQVFKHQPRFGGLCVDVKGCSWKSGPSTPRRTGSPATGSTWWAIARSPSRPTPGAWWIPPSPWAAGASRASSAITLPNPRATGRHHGHGGQLPALRSASSGRSPVAKKDL
ncbi:MAG: hypothetical protein M5U12_32895 [Verrucomicrobia bacterium]|nr:hypothetical protein [Verrucomicrobiota bacterium]